MELHNVEIGTSIIFTDEDGVHTFIEGDDVICIVGDKRYVGVISVIGNYTDSEDEEPWRAIYLNTSDKKNKRAFSSEIIKVNDITYICKNPLADTPKKVKTQEEADKDKFVSLLCGIGYDKDGVEKIYSNVKGIMDKGNISLEQMIPCVIYSLENHCSINEPLKDMLNFDIDKTLEQYKKMLHFSVGMMFYALGEVFQVILDEFSPKRNKNK